MIDPQARARLEKLTDALSVAVPSIAVAHVYGGNHDEQCVTLNRDLRALLADSLPGEGERERIARIVDPGAWVGSTYATMDMIEARARALAKADQIMERNNG